MKNYSRQREAILNVSRSTDTHPTANQVYTLVRQEIPNISLGTVYRNLAALSEAGEILSINVGDGFEHFDGDKSHHLHLHCRSCGSIVDAAFDQNLFDKLFLSSGFTPDTSVCVVYGICKECEQNSKI